MTQIILNVPDISCEHCERTITNALTPVDGVRGVSVDIPAKQVRVDYDETQVDPDRMKQLLEAEDYPVASADPA
jgi:copper chaperone